MLIIIWLSRKFWKSCVPTQLLSDGARHPDARHFVRVAGEKKNIKSIKMLLNVPVPSQNQSYRKVQYFLVIYALRLKQEHDNSINHLRSAYWKQIFLTNKSRRNCKNKNVILFKHFLFDWLLMNANEHNNNGSNKSNFIQSLLHGPNNLF